MSDEQFARDVEAIKILKARYFRYYDEKQWEEWRSLFSDDFEFHGDFAVWNREEFVDFNVAMNTDHRVVSVHHGFCPEIDLGDDGTAVGVWAMQDHMEYPEFDPPKGMRGVGYYDDEYRKEGGVWLMTKSRLRRLRIDPLPGGFPPEQPYGD